MYRYNFQECLVLQLVKITGTQFGKYMYEDCAKGLARGHGAP